MSSPRMPAIKLGSHTISRLILGANTINGGSHLSRFVNNRMKEYFTHERILDTLRACELAGINTWQAGPGNLDLYEEYRRTGGAMHFISLDHEHPEKGHSIGKLARAGAIAVAHHGEVTDRLFLSGDLDRIYPFIQKIHDAGMVAGVSTHIPEVVDRIGEAGWDVDFFMTCVYQRHRSKEELQKLLGHVPIPVKEVYLEDDPPRMWDVMRRTDKPCLAFKILAAGRLCERQEDVALAFHDTLLSIKKTDGLIVGMYPEYEDQIALNTTYIKTYGS